MALGGNSDVPMDDVTISFDPARVARDRVQGWLSREAYWSPGHDRGVFERAIANSLVASAFVGSEQVEIEHHLPLHRVGGQTVHHPYAVLKADGKPYTVYTPYAKHGRQNFHQS